MSNLLINGTISSLEVAELTGKRHSNVLRDIYSIEENLKKEMDSNLSSSVSKGSVMNIDELWSYSGYKDKSNRTKTCVKLTKKGSLLLATKYSDSVRLKLINRWEELEKKNALPDFTDPAQAAMAWATEFNKKKEIANKLRLANEKIEKNRSKVLFADTVIGSSNSILVRQFAKDLSENGFVIGQNRLYEWFRENKYLSGNNEPYQNYMDRGYFEVITRTIGSGDDTITVKTTKITGKGQVYFADKLKQTYINTCVNNLN